MPQFLSLKREGGGSNDTHIHIHMHISLGCIFVIASTFCVLSASIKMTLQKLKSGAVEMAQQLEVRVAIPKFPAPTLGVSQPSATSAPGNPISLTSISTYIHAHMHTHTLKYLSIIFKLK